MPTASPLCPRPADNIIACPAAVTHGALLNFLSILDRDFQPPLSARADLDSYATKLITHATLATARRTDGLTGVVAMYCNDLKAKIAYISFVGVLPTARGDGIGRALVSACTAFAKNIGMRSLALQVDAKDENVVRFYQKLGFIIAETYPRFENSVAHRLQLDLTGPNTAPSPL